VPTPIGSPRRGCSSPSSLFRGRRSPTLGSRSTCCAEPTHRNAGLLIDVWHFYNGGGHPDQLVGLPTAGITGFQLNDGPLVHDDFQRHARAERELPGEGELDVIGLISPSPFGYSVAGFRPEG
jgi:hypothetical protein